MRDYGTAICQLVLFSASGCGSQVRVVCRAIWGFTLDDFTDDDLSPEDHAWFDGLTQECAIEFTAEQGYDLKDYIHGGCVADSWGLRTR